MKFSDFVKKYPYYSRFRFSSNNGNVVFNFNGDEYDPFDSQGRLVKTLYHFPGDSWPPENINDFLITDDKKANEELEGFPLYRFNGRAEYKLTPWDSNPSKLNYYSFDIYITPGKKQQLCF